MLNRLGLICSIFGIILISGVAVYFSKFVLSFMPLVVVLDCFIIYNILLYRQVEFEYVVVNDEIDVDKIFWKKKRKRLITIKRSDIVSFGSVKDDGYMSCKKKSSKMINASSDRCGTEDYYVLLKDKKNTLVILEKDERLLRVIKR